MFRQFAKWTGAKAAERVSISSLGATQAHACCILHATSFAHPWSVADFEAFLLERSIVADGAFTRRLAGFSLSRLAGDEAEILAIVVDSSHRRHGIGRQLLVAHLGHVAAAGARQIFLEVDEQNAPALRLYISTGFAEVGKRPAYYRKTDGSRGNALILRCPLG